MAGLVLYLLFPNAATRAAVEVRRRPGLYAGVGFAVLFLTPVAMVLLFITGLGVLLGFLLLALYLAALLAGGLVGAYALTDMALVAARRSQAGHGLRAAALVVIIFVIGMLQWVPVLGWLLSLLLLLWGLGAIAGLTWHPSPAAPRN
jgi:hypothetical protein